MKTPSIFRAMTAIAFTLTISFSAYAQVAKTLITKQAFVAVTGISGVPDKATADTPLTLTGTVAPSNATNKTIEWSMVSAGTTKAKIERGGSAFSAAEAGTVTIRATIANGVAEGKNYTQDFTITVSEPINRAAALQAMRTLQFVAVEVIIDVPDKATTGKPLTLTSKVTPENATNKTIEWMVHPGDRTKAKIEGNIFTATAPGMVMVRATIAKGLADDKNFFQDFKIFVSNIAVTGINGVPDKATAGTPITLTGTVHPSNATNKTIEWSVVSAGNTKAKIEKDGNAFNAPEAGTVTIRATIINGVDDGKNYTQDFTIIVSAPRLPITRPK